MSESLADWKLTSFQALGRLSAVSVPARFFTEIGQACGCPNRSSANEPGQGMQIASTKELGRRGLISGSRRLHGNDLIEGCLPGLRRGPEDRIGCHLLWKRAT